MLVGANRLRCAPRSEELDTESVLRGKSVSAPIHVSRVDLDEQEQARNYTLSCAQPVNMFIAIS